MTRCCLVVSACDSVSLLCAQSLTDRYLAPGSRKGSGLAMFCYRDGAESPLSPSTLLLLSRNPVCFCICGSVLCMITCVLSQHHTSHLFFEVFEGVWQKVTLSLSLVTEPTRHSLCYDRDVALCMSSAEATETTGRLVRQMLQVPWGVVPEIKNTSIT